MIGILSLDDLQYIVQEVELEESMARSILKMVVKMV